MKHLGVLIPIILVICSAIGGALYRHETSILNLFKKGERLQVKDYRQHRDVLRIRVSALSESVTSVESVLEADANAFGPGGSLILKQRKEQLIEARERLENYVEENKHYGGDD